MFIRAMSSANQKVEAALRTSTPHKKNSKRIPSPSQYTRPTQEKRKKPSSHALHTHTPNPPHIFPHRHHHRHIPAPPPGPPGVHRPIGPPMHPSLGLHLHQRPNPPLPDTITIPPLAPPAPNPSIRRRPMSPFKHHNNRPEPPSKFPCLPGGSQCHILPALHPPAFINCPHNPNSRGTHFQGNDVRPLP